LLERINHFDRLLYAPQSLRITISTGSRRRRRHHHHHRHRLRSIMTSCDDNMLLVTVQFSTTSTISTVITPGPRTVAEFCQHVVEELLPGDLVAMLYTGQSMVCLDYGIADSNTTMLHHGQSSVPEDAPAAEPTPVVCYSVRMSIILESVALPAVCAPKQSMYALVLAARASSPSGTNVVLSIRPIKIPTQPRRGGTNDNGNRHINVLDYGYRPAPTTRKSPRKRALSKTKTTTTKTSPPRDRSQPPIKDTVGPLRKRQRPRTIVPTEEPTNVDSQASLPNNQPTVVKTGKAVATTASTSKAQPSSDPTVVVNKPTKKSRQTTSLGSFLEPLPLDMPSTRLTKDELSILAQAFLEEEQDVEEDRQRTLTDDELFLLGRAFLKGDDEETATTTTTKKKKRVVLGSIPLRGWGRRKPDHRAYP
jgi:hypothetical protein